MNEEELKKLWQADNAAPAIDFTEFQNSLTAWQNKLRRKARIDIWAQGLFTALCLISVFFYPKLVFAYVLLIILAVWYVRELRGLYQEEINENHLDIRHSLDVKILTMKRFFRQTRIAMYVFSPLIFLAAYFGLNAYTHYSATVKNPIFSFFTTLIAYEILIVIATEIYFAIIYAPALNELKNLLRQLDADE